MLFVQSGQIQIAAKDPGADNFEPFVVEKNQLAVIPSVTAPWTLVQDQPAEVIRILPAQD